jgi:hypothetical protein
MLLGQHENKQVFCAFNSRFAKFRSLPSANVGTVQKWTVNFFNLSDWFELLTVNAKASKLLGSNPSSFGTLETEVRQMKQ